MPNNTVPPPDPAANWTPLFWTRLQAALAARDGGGCERGQAVSGAADVLLRFLQRGECWCLNDWVCRRCEALEAFEEMQRELAAAKAVADIAAAFRAADLARVAHLRGCVMPDPTDTWVAARDAYRAAMDAWLTAAGPGAAEVQG